MRKSADKPLILCDERYLYCISLANLSKNDRRTGQRFGSILTKNGQIIGKGFNRAVNHPRFKLERVIRQGWVNHAEIEAINDALNRDYDVNDSELYVAGYFLESEQLFFQERYSCRRCPPIIEKYGIRINSIHIPTPDKWTRRTMREAWEEAKEFRGSAYDERRRECIGNYPIGLIKDSLLTRHMLFPDRDDI